jgi:hypothetical protein
VEAILVHSGHRSWHAANSYVQDDEAWGMT